MKKLELELELAFAELVFVLSISVMTILASLIGSEQFEGLVSILFVYMIVSQIRNILTSKGE